MNAVRKVFYTITVTGLSAALAPIVSTVELLVWRFGAVEERWSSNLR